MPKGRLQMIGVKKLRVEKLKSWKLKSWKVKKHYNCETINNEIECGSMKTGPKENSS